MSKEIPIHNSDLIILVDDEDCVYLSQFKWFIRKTKNNMYAKTFVNKGKEPIKTEEMHRMLIKRLKGQEIDHINRNGLDNRKENLRISTRAQNSMNRAKYKNKVFSSIYKGVHKNPNNSFSATIWLNKKSVRIGSFRSEEEAAKAYDARATIEFGEFAYLNFPKLIIDL